MRAIFTSSIFSSFSVGFLARLVDLDLRFDVVVDLEEACFFSFLVSRDFERCSLDDRELADDLDRERELYELVLGIDEKINSICSFRFKI
jgi:hypothetical protein